MEAVNMKDLLLERIYFVIRTQANKGQRKMHEYVDKYKMEDIKAVIKELEDDGYTVRLRRSGFLFKRVTTFTNILIKW